MQRSTVGSTGKAPRLCVRVRVSHGVVLVVVVQATRRP